jgi:hypothetical protein
MNTTHTLKRAIAGTLQSGGVAVAGNDIRDVRAFRTMTSN